MNRYILNIRLRKVEEYVKKQTEVPEVPKQTLKSLEEHNKQAYTNFAAVNNLKDRKLVYKLKTIKR